MLSPQIMKIKLDKEKDTIWETNDAENKEQKTKDRMNSLQIS